MPHKVKTDREAILKASFEIAKSEGISAITAQSVSKVLKISVAPIFRVFQTVEELRVATVEKIDQFHTEYIKNYLCFRMSLIEEFEEDLTEIKTYQPYERRIFWTGANPFAMNYENLKLRALTVRDYLIKCQSMAMFVSIRDIQNKEVW